MSVEGTAAWTVCVGHCSFGNGAWPYGGLSVQLTEAEPTPVPARYDSSR